MRADSPQWIQMGPAATKEEQHALDLVRDLLPDGGLTWAWSNLTFIDRNGRPGEIDVLLLNRTGLHVVELKGYHGTITGDQQHWTIARPNRPDEPVDNPFLATDRKAKRLKTLLKDVAVAAKGKITIPFVDAVTVLHGDGTKVDLDPIAATATYALDGAGVSGLPAFSEFLNAAPADVRNLVDKSRAKALVALLKAAGFTATPKVRKAGQYEIDLKAQLAEGETWVDVEAVHPAMPGVHRRIRLYDVPLNASAQQRATIANLAKREYLLTTGLGHPGVVAALDYLDTESGPALVFPDDEGSTPLTDWLDDNADQVGFDDRLALLRQIAEVVRYAHAQRVQHRTLGPTKVHVVEVSGQPRRVTVRDWQTGKFDQVADATALPPTALRGSTLHLDPTDLAGLLYLAPEAQTERADPIALDVYGLGALGYLLLTLGPPASTIAELQDRWARGGLDPSVDLDGLPESLVALVRRATDPRVMDRTPSVEAFLADLDAARQELREEAIAPVSAVTDPLDAQAGDIIGDWLVEERLGSGSSGLALLVSDGTADAPTHVLKVAHDQSKARRLMAEAETLARLDHPRVVRLVEGPFDLEGRTCLLLEDAGRPTLARRLRDGGPLTLEQLEKFASDLFDVATYLDRQKVFHRDLKPDNLGVRPDPGDRRPRLVLFDFSLAHEPLDATGSGTTPYLDPFLGTARRPRYDSAAERFALAVTLFEMASARTPEWGDGLSAPAAIDAEVTVVPTMFDHAVGEGLAAFFSRALARDAAARFSDLPEIAEAWQSVFRTVTVPAEEAEQDEATRDAAAAAAQLGTPLTSAGLTARAVSALSRLGAESVDDVIALPGMRINQMSGIGVEVRREIQRRRAEWTDRLTGRIADEEPPAKGTGVEDLLERLVPRPNGKNADAVALAKALVASAGYGEPSSAGWPSWTQLTDSAGVDPDAVAALQAAWSRSEVVSSVRDEVFGLLESLHGMATPEELARLLVKRHGSTAEGQQRLANASLLVRAAAELPTDEAGLTVSRGKGADNSLLLALGDPDTDDASARLDVVRSLAAAIDTAVLERPAVHGSAESQRLVTEHPAVVAGQGLPGPSRLLAVAVAASVHGALSPRGEIYPIGLSAEESVRAVLAGGLRLVTVDGLQRRVAQRFTAAANLPPRPALDELVSRAAPALHWHDGAYTRASGTGSMLRTATRVGSQDLDDGGLLGVDQRLTDSLVTRSGLVLAVPPRLLDQAPAALAARYGVRPVDVTALLIHAMHDVARDSNVDWTVVLRADAAPSTSVDRQRLARLVQMALDRCWPDLAADPGPLLLTDLAPLARYGQSALLSPITDLTVAKPAARWLLVPRRAAGAAPTLEGHPMPLAADGWLDLPSALLTTPAEPGVAL